VEVVYARCAGLDIGKDEVVACVRVPDGVGGRHQEVRTFKTFSAELEALADWRTEQGSPRWCWRRPASTGSRAGRCWKSAGWSCCWSTPATSRSCPAPRPTVVMRRGRPSCWSTGCCVAASSRRPRSGSCGISPATASGPFQAHTAECQRIHKTLEDASIRLGSVAARGAWGLGPGDVAGAAGRRARPNVLAGLARGRLRTKLPELCQALRGRFLVHHALLLRLALEHVEQLERSIAELDAEIDRVITPFAEARDRLDTITGVGKRAAEAIIAEIGVDMSVFPSAAHLASWAGRCPGTT
jgi:transposase